MRTWKKSPLGKIMLMMIVLGAGLAVSAGTVSELRFLPGDEAFGPAAGI